jgi:hypothetical protein
VKYFELLHPTSLGEFSITMRGEDEFGTAIFIDDPTATVSINKVEIDVDLDIKKFDKIGPDYLQTTKGIPIFSEKFVTSMPEAFAQSVTMVPATLYLRGGTRDYRAGKIELALDLIDTDASSFSNIRGIRILTRPVFKPVTQEFYLARDHAFRMYMVASEKLVQQVETHGLKLEFLPY